MNTTIKYPSQKWVNNTVGKPSFNDLYGRVLLDYTISKKILVSFQYSGISSKNPLKSNSKTKIYDTQNNIDSLMLNKKTSNESYYSHALNIHNQSNLDTLGRNLSIDIDYYTFLKSTDDFFESSTSNVFVSNNNFGTNRLNSLSGKINLELPYKFAKIETGIKASAVKNNSDIKNYDIISGTQILNNNQSNVFKYTENNQAVYFSASKELSEKWKTQIGLRFEAVQTNGFSKTLNKTTKNDYTKLFPTFYLSYEINKNNSLSFNYGKRIKRPYFFQLNPFRSNIDIFSYTEGNPLLKPSFIENIELSHSYKDLFQTTIYFKGIENGFNQITIFHPNNIQQIIPKNYFNSNEFGLTESISFNMTKFWETSNDIYIYYLKATSVIPKVQSKNEGTNVFLSTNNSFILNTKKTLFATLNYWYQFPETVGLQNTDAYSRFDFGFRGLFFNKKIIVSIGISDLFKTHQPSYSTLYNNIKTTFNSYYDKRRLNLSITYRFGNNKIKGKSNKGSNQEEKNRTN
ncbi:MAG: outer membrane beta-barrel family protein [Polaribacter sp.]